MQESENIKPCGDKFEYIEAVKTEDKFKIIDKNIPSKNSDITVIESCETFLDIKQKTLTEMSFQAYKTFVYSKIITYFKNFRLKDIAIQDIQNFKKYLQENKISERRIKNILALLNQIIKYFQNEGYIDKIVLLKLKELLTFQKEKYKFCHRNNWRSFLKS